MLRLFATILTVFLSTTAAKAQELFWVQIEASRTLTEAQERARFYAGRFDDLQGYYLGTGFYGIVLGPYPETTARQRLSRLLASGQIPSDSYLQNGRRFEQQFWPVGGGTSPLILPEPQAPTVNPIPGPQETLREARASEAALSREEREALQEALQWAGFYRAAIDGSFGRGTRAAMEEWQVANLQQPTGVLTTQQRALLFRQFNEVLDGMDMALVEDRTAGVAIEMPTAVVRQSDIQPPFVTYDSTGEVPGAQVILISQPGDADKMRGLYEVMQSLDIVPIDGNREFSSRGFFIEGLDETVHSFTEVRLQDNEITGFTLVWPADDAVRRARILGLMRDSFTPLGGVMPPDLVPASETQSIDMVSGLSIRQPRLSRSGIYVSDVGHVVTTTEAIDSCERITLDRDHPAEVIAADAARGLAVLMPTDKLAPLDVAVFQGQTPRLQDQIAVGGYPFGGVLGAASLTYGQLVDLRDLSGDDSRSRLSLTSAAGDAGGPVLDGAGMVLGMLLPRATGTAQNLPADVSFAVKADQITVLLASLGITPVVSDQQTPVSPVVLSQRATDITALVSCW